MGQPETRLYAKSLGATTYRRVIGRDHRFPADERIDRQRPTELESALPATSYGLDLDLVCEKLSDATLTLQEVDNVL